MALQWSVAVRNGMLDAIEDVIGASPVLKVRTGSPPASVAADDTGTVLSTVQLPASWMQAAASGQKVKSGDWQDAEADASGTPGHFRIYASGGACHMQGTVTTSGQGGDMIVNLSPFVAGRPFTVLSFTLAASGA